MYKILQKLDNIENKLNTNYRAVESRSISYYIQQISTATRAINNILSTDKNIELTPRTINSLAKLLDLREHRLKEHFGGDDDYSVSMQAKELSEHTLFPLLGRQAKLEYRYENIDDDERMKFAVIILNPE